jgi:hypothetical protein
MLCTMEWSSPCPLHRERSPSTHYQAKLGDTPQYYGHVQGHSMTLRSGNDIFNYLEPPKKQIQWTHFGHYYACMIL